MLKGELGKKALSTDKTAYPTATQRVQRGTKWPVGKRNKKTMREGKPIFQHSEKVCDKDGRQRRYSRSERGTVALGPPLLSLPRSLGV